MAHGYDAQWIAYYNRYSEPTFSVGEYDWSKQDKMRGWIWDSAVITDSQGAAHLATASNGFDFGTFFSLKDHKGVGQYNSWHGYGNGIGLVGDTTDLLSWKNRAVTFAENHDTGYRTNSDGTAMPDNKNHSFANTWEIEQAYAQILTHPGIPCVFWNHYFHWGADLQNSIKSLINARKAAGIHAGSELNLQDNARNAGVYAARVVGTKGELYVRIGGNENSWNPSFSGYRDYHEYANGDGWKVWVKLPNNPDLVQVPLRDKLLIPTFIKPQDVQLPKEADK
jgi:alpha-amylase